MLWEAGGKSCMEPAVKVPFRGHWVLAHHSPSPARHHSSTAVSHVTAHVCRRMHGSAHWHYTNRPTRHALCQAGTTKTPPYGTQPTQPTPRRSNQRRRLFCTRIESTFPTHAVAVCAESVHTQIRRLYTTKRAASVRLVPAEPRCCARKKKPAK